MAKRTTTKDYLLKLLTDLSNHNIHTSDDQDWPDELRDRVHNLIDCLEKSSDSIPADLKNTNCAIFDVSGSLPIRIKNKKKLEKGDVFLWRSEITGKYEIHTFHSDAGYGIKTFTNYNEKDGSSMLVNWSGVCGVLEGNDR